MARKKSRGSAIDFLAAMREMFRESTSAGQVGIAKQVRNTGIQSWRDNVDRLIDRLFDGNVFPAYGQNIEFKQIFANGDITAKVEDSNESFDCFVRTKSDEEPVVSCACDDSRGVEVCEHIKQVLWRLRSSLMYPTHILTRRIVEKQFDTGSLDLKKFQVDRSQRSLEKLAHIARSVSAVQRELDSPQLFEIAPTKPDSRIVWNIEMGHDPVVVPMVQQKKKSGSGYNKPKEVALADLALLHSQSLRDLDRKIIALVKRSSRYAPNEIPFAESIRLLEGDDHVFLDGNPVVVELVGMTLSLGIDKRDGTLCFVPTTLAGEIFKGSIFTGQNFSFMHDEAKGTFTLLTYPPEQHECIWSLIRLPPIDDKRQPELIEKMVELQRTLPILLPTSSDVPLNRAEGRPVILLRSRSTGQLDFGIRMKLPSGRIVVPGAPPFVEQTKDESTDRTKANENLTIQNGMGKITQWVRNPNDETAVASKWLRDLNLQAYAGVDFSGTIEQLDDSLRLLEQLELRKDEIEVLWSKDSDKPSRVLGSISAKNLRVQITSKRNWFGITGECQLGDESLPLEQILEYLGTSADPELGGYVRIGDGQWARIEDGLRSRLQQVREATHSERKNLLMDSTAAQAIQSLSQIDVDVKAAKAWEDCMSRLARAEFLTPTLPKGLKAELRDYQVEGYQWLRRLAEWGVGGILADDMGLGKTLQTLAVLLDRASEGPALVIAPTSVGFNWIRECERFAPELKPILYRESDRKDVLANLTKGDLVVSSYALALRDETDLVKIEWGTLVMDEAQAIKNARSKTSQAVATFNAKWTIALTGTPMENHLGELWSLFSVVSPGVFGGWESFRKRYATPIEKQNDDDAKASLSRRLRPFILRRTKEEVLAELPPRTEMVIYVDLSPEERAQYELIRRSAIGEVKNIATLPDIKDQRFKILALLTRLRQFACHPGIVNKQWQKSSAKLDQLCETLTNLQQEGHRALVFSQFTEHLALIRAALETQGISYQYLDGSTPAAERQNRVDEFQKGASTAFLISLKAGGTGLNLTAADYVIHMDPWWNPAVEDQATDRAHRFGQTKPVMVYRIVARGTIEEEILALHESKRDLVEGILDGTNAAAKLSTKDLIEIISKT